MTKSSAKQRVTKKMLAVEMYQKGMNTLVIAELLRTEPSYVANALIERGYAPSYADLYTSTGPQNEYATLFKGLGGLRFKNLDAARQSVARIEALYQRFKEVAERIEIPIADDLMPEYSSTDADAMQLIAEGIPTMVVSIPQRYMHTAVELVALKDIQRAGRLMAEFVASLEADFLERIVWD